MESCLMNYFIINTELKDTCECNPKLFDEAPSIYEVVRVEKGMPLFLENHIERFYNSAVLLKEKIPVKENQIISRVKAVIDANQIQSGLIKFIYLNHPVAGSLFAVWVAPFFFPSAETYKKGVSVVSLKGNRINPNAKRSHQSVRAQADELIKSKKVYEVMLINDGVITEGSRSNLFFVENGILFTPHHNLVLEGITRGKIINLALDSGIDVLESEYTTEEMTGFEAAFITGTTPKVLPVNKIDRISFRIDHPVTLHLSKEYEKMILKYVKEFSW
jgi:branched-chain amino acid aminotransferase